MKKITWFEFNRSDKGEPFVTAYDGDTPVYTHKMSTLKELCEWGNKIDGMNNNVLVADTSKKIIPNVPDYSTEPNPPKSKEWIPFAVRASTAMPVRVKKWPKYLVIHWTAGEPSQRGEDGIAAGAKNGYTYLFLEKGGRLWQGAPTNGGGYHLGSGTIDSFEALGVEVACAGNLKKRGDLFVPWYAERSDGSINESRCIPKNEVIYDGDGPEDDESFAGYYHLYTHAQKETLKKLALYFCQELGGSPDRIIGHDMAATPRGRKTDPGLSLGEGGMVQWRKEIRSALEKGIKWSDL